MAELYLVRHGQASFGTDNYDRLSKLGHQQSEWLGDHFKTQGLEFEKIITGDLVRHHETAQGIVRGMKAASTEFDVLPGFNEFDFEALLLAYAKQFPDRKLDSNATAIDYSKRLKHCLLLWARGELEGQLPETWQAFEQRVSNVLNIVKDLPQKKVLVVSSGGAISMVIRQILNAPGETMVELNLQARNTGVSHFFFNRQNVRLSSFNGVPHLERPERRDSITF